MLTYADVCWRMLAYADVQGPNFVAEGNTPEKQSPILAAKPAAWYLSLASLSNSEISLVSLSLFYNIEPGISLVSRSIFYNLRA